MVTVVTRYRPVSKSYPANLTAPGSARAHLQAILRNFELSPESDRAQVAISVVSELVANAVGRLPDGDASVDVHVLYIYDGVQLLVHVHDRLAGNLQIHDMPAPDADAENGRGLAMVDILSAHWGWHPRASGGHCVWAVVDMLDSSDSELSV